MVWREEPEDSGRILDASVGVSAGSRGSRGHWDRPLLTPSSSEIPIAFPAVVNWRSIVLCCAHFWDRVRDISHLLSSPPPPAGTLIIVRLSFSFFKLSHL